MRVTVALVLLLLVQAAPPEQLPAPAVRQLQESLRAAAAHRVNLWRDTPPFTPAGQLHALVEIPRGERRKFEFDIAANAMRIDRIMPAALGGYPVNYGIVPQTVSYDGDPFDVLVLGPPLPSGALTSGTIVAVMRMEDEKGLDSKVVIAPVDDAGRARVALTANDRERMTRFFNAYKRNEPGKFSRVPGWGSADEGRTLVDLTHRFFTLCRTAAGDCTFAH